MKPLGVESKVTNIPAATVSACTAGASVDEVSASVSAGAAGFFLASSGFGIPFIGPLPASGFACSLDAGTLLAGAGSDASAVVEESVGSSVGATVK